DYEALIERVRTGDLQELSDESLFTNLLFANAERLQELSQRIDTAVERQRSVASNGSAAPLPVRRDLESELERLRGELAHRSRFESSLRHFLERISSDS
ncbi:MAG: hypothetical protein ABR555_08355, partial [Pyrinomonadaceae bacterium]